MLDHILRQVQAFELAHGRRPNVVFISSDHLRALRCLYPELFAQDPALELGFRFIVVPGSEIPHPRAALVPERRNPQQRDAA